MQPPRPFLDGMHYAFLLSLWLLKTNYQLLRQGQGNILRRFRNHKIKKNIFSTIPNESPTKWQRICAKLISQDCKFNFILKGRGDEPHTMTCAFLQQNRNTTILLLIWQEIFPLYNVIRMKDCIKQDLKRTSVTKREKVSWQSTKT